MQNPSTSLSTAAKTPSKLSAFMGGFKTGSLNGGLMLGIFSVIGVVTSVVTTGALAFPLTLGAIAMTAATTGVFSGILGMKRANDGAKASPKVAASHAKAASLAHGHAVAPQVEIAEAVDHAPQQGSWVARTGGSRTDRAQSRVEQILAARENAVNNSASIG